MLDILKGFKKELTGCLILLLCWFIFIFIIKGSFGLLFNTGEDVTTRKDNIVYATYQEAVKADDFEAAHNFLEEIYDEFQETWESNIGDVGSENHLEGETHASSAISSAAMKYSQAASYVLCAEARYIIANIPDEANDRIAYLFNEIRVMGEKVDNYYSDGATHYQVDCAKYDCYIQTVKCNNELCDVVLNLAIQHHNKELAELALSYYREKGKANDGPIYWTNEDQRAAQAKYEKALSEGKFD